MNIDAIRHVNQINKGQKKPSKREREAWATIERIVKQGQSNKVKGTP